MRTPPAGVKDLGNMVKFTYLNPFPILMLLLMSSHILFRKKMDNNGGHFIVVFTPSTHQCCGFYMP
jgi:hypothetical protein